MQGVDQQIADAYRQKRRSGLAGRRGSFNATIVRLLMAFLIQNTQNRDTPALQTEAR
jgi:hypothetical protein